MRKKYSEAATAHLLPTLSKHNNMKLGKTLFLLSLCAAPLCMSAQDTIRTQKNWLDFPLHFGTDVTGGSDFDKFRTFSFNLSMEYYFTKRFSVVAKYDYTYGLFKDGDNRTWHKNHALGGGLGYRLLQFKDGSGVAGQKGDDGLDLILTAGSTVGKGAWRFVYYDAALRLASFKRNTTTISFGYRYYDATKNSPVGNLSSIYVSLGYRF